MKARIILSADKKDFYKELFSLAIPIGMQNLLVALIGATDALMLGRFSQDAVSAVSLANQVVFIMNLFIGAVVGGGGVLLAQYWGKGDRTMVKNIFSNGHLEYPLCSLRLPCSFLKHLCGFIRPNRSLLRLEHLICVRWRFPICSQALPIAIIL